MNDIEGLVRNLDTWPVWLEFLVLAGCLFLAWMIAWGLGRRRTGESVLFGHRIVDGLLFPALALVLVFGVGREMVAHQPVVVLKLAVPILLSLALIRLCVGVLRLSFPHSRLALLVERLLSWLLWLVAVLWITGFLPQVKHQLESVILTFGNSKVTLLTLISGGFSALLVLIAVLWVSETIERRVLSETVEDRSLRKVVFNVMRAVLLLIGLLLLLSAMGVDVTALSVLGGALGIGLGFGMQQLAANYVSGFVVLLERSIRIGDTIRVGEFQGQVTDINTRYTLIRSMDGTEAIVPNEHLVTERVENLTSADGAAGDSDSTKVLQRIDVRAGYASDVDQVLRILCEAATSITRVLREPAPAAFLSNFGENGLEFTLTFWIADPENGLLALRSDIYLHILREFHKAGIDIPYPQRVIHMK
jgi:small-conductance mechanosensitive channel